MSALQFQTSRAIEIIPQTPRIMRAMGWDVAAHLMQTWLDAPAHDFSDYGGPPHARARYLSSLDMEFMGQRFSRFSCSDDCGFVDSGCGWTEPVVTATQRREAVGFGGAFH